MAASTFFVYLDVRSEPVAQYGNYQLMRHTIALKNGRVLRRWWIITPLKEANHAA